MEDPSSTQPEYERLLVELVDNFSMTLHSLDELVLILDGDGRFIDFQSPAGRCLFLAKPYAEQNVADASRAPLLATGG